MSNSSNVDANRRDYERHLTDPLTSQAAAYAAQQKAKQDAKKKKQKPRRRTRSGSGGSGAQQGGGQSGQAANVSLSAQPASSDPFGGSAGFSVYDGHQQEPDFPLAPGAMPHAEPTQPATIDAAQATSRALVGKTKAQIKDLQQRLVKGGYSGVAVTGLVDTGLMNAYQLLLQNTYVANKAGQMLTPDQYLQQQIQGLVKPQAAKKTTTTSTSLNLTNARDARDAAIKAFTAALGRRPSQSEIDAFYGALTAYERANPSVTTETQDANGAGSQQTYDTTTTGGATTPDTFASQYVEQNFPTEAGNHSALHYFDLVNSVLTGPPPGVHQANA